MTETILIVDDDPDIVFFVKQTLEKEGFSVLTAEEGGAALKLLKTHTPNLIIADLSMPGMGGWHFTTKVRFDPRFKKTPIIVISGLLERDAEPQEFETASAYIVKPFDIFKLIDKIKELLKK